MNDKCEDTPRWTNPVQHEIALHAEDRHIDMFGHVNNAWYIAWAMECAWAHSEALGLDFAAYERIGAGCVVRHHDYTYHMSAMPGDDIRIGTWIQDTDGRLQMRRGIEMRRAGDGRLVMDGFTQFVSINLKTGRPMRMPAEFVTAYQPPLSLRA